MGVDLVSFPDAKETRRVELTTPGEFPHRLAFSKSGRYLAVAVRRVGQPGQSGVNFFQERGGRVLVRESLSVVKMKRLSDAELNAYLASGEWQGKAGGYGIQGLAGALIPWISGSFTGIMGLPVAETAALLVAVGYPVWRQE